MFAGAKVKSVEKMPLIDSVTPYNVQLSGFYKRSFAYFTVKERLPIIVTKIIDQLSRARDSIANEYGEAAFEDVKIAIGYLSKLKNEIQTNKRLEPITVEGEDVNEWNSLIVHHQDPYYFTAVWLFTECYVYRRIREAFQITKSLQAYDPFRIQKDTTFQQSLEAMCSVADHLSLALEDTSNLKDNFLMLLKMTLWGNKCDLSLSAGTEVSQATNPITMVDLWQDNLIIDNSDLVFTDLQRFAQEAEGKEIIVDFVCDNAGYELYVDLCFADYLISKKLASKVRFRVKAIPWFVSDVMMRDFSWTLDSCSTADFRKDVLSETGASNMLNSNNLKALGTKWKDYVEKGIWSCQVNNFWTTPYEFYKMKEVDKELYRSMNEAAMIFFKGDLNYRKLMAEVNWPPTTPFENALNDFFPGPLVAVRTVKADLISGLPQGKMEDLNLKDEKWMEKGDYGIIQYCSKKIILSHLVES